ncbi:hypothetical protein GCM10009579_72840 [Streptomyces javensis]|uniref:Uncharacterized protein n=1 Tax=Streptomyces javensis TaxID=114698 RepID=A0ABP4I023_9ACTN
MVKESSEFAERLEVGSGIGGRDLDLLGGGVLLCRLRTVYCGVAVAPSAVRRKTKS